MTAVSPLTEKGSTYGRTVRELGAGYGPPSIFLLLPPPSIGTDNLSLSSRFDNKTTFFSYGTLAVSERSHHLSGSREEMGDMERSSSLNVARSIAILGVLFVLVISVGQPAAAKTGPGAATHSYATPVFGIATAPDGSLMVADYGAGIVELRKGADKLIADLPAVSDIAPIGRGAMFAVTGIAITPDFEDTAQKLYRVSRGHVRQIADLFAFEQTVNPHQAEIDSNPFDVAALTGGKALVADAGGNDLLIVDRRGNVDWVATFPDELVSTANVKDLVGCPNPSPICGLPGVFPAEAVPTSVAIGPDGAYYVGELKGFPAPVGESQVWRIEPGTRHAVCPSPACAVVADGFTSIVDLTFGPDGTLYVVELDEASWWSVEFGPPGPGGTVNACDVGSWTCTVVASGLPMSMAATIGHDGAIYVVVWALVPGLAAVVKLP